LSFIGSLAKGIFGTATKLNHWRSY
jgi:hypothetical protein